MFDLAVETKKISACLQAFHGIFLVCSRISWFPFRGNLVILYCFLFLNRIMGDASCPSGRILQTPKGYGTMNYCSIVN